MSRIDGACEESYPLNLWRGMVKRATQTPKGQARLREVEAALLALPEQRLATDEIADYDGNVCAVGALMLYHALQRGEDRADWLEWQQGRDVDIWDMQRYGREEGLTDTLVWELVRVVDEQYGHATPEARYAATLAWVQEHLKPLAPTAGKETPHVP